MGDLHGPRLLADIGGTHARFARQAAPGQPPADVQVLACAQHATIDDAVAAYLAAVGGPMPVDCALAVATPVDGDVVAMTNHHWRFSARALQARFGWRRLRVLNDFSALALALPHLQPDELHPLGGGEALPGRAIALVGPGTGLGVSGLLPVTPGDPRTAWAPIEGEGGHVTLASRTPREHAVLQQLALQHGHVSAERALSGAGLVALRRALCRLDGLAEPPAAASAADVVQAARQGDATCAEALDLFCAFLGSVAGDLALTLGARGGVYVGGGIVPRLADWVEQSAFRRRFEDKGRFAGYLARIPVRLIVARQSPALLGASIALDRAAPQQPPEHPHDEVHDRTTTGAEAAADPTEETRA